MQEINAEYDRLFKMLKNKHESKATDSNNENQGNDFNNMKYDFTEDAILREMLNKIIGFHGITIEIIGQWIWISGNTYANRKSLKEMGFKWASAKKMWFWHSEAYQKKSRKTLSIDEIRSYYGTTEVQSGQRRLLRQA